MATDITLSKGVRQNLLSLQSTAELLNRTQERLATGKKVNSALDNPINFFTSAGLSSRANDLSRLLDSVGNAVQTINAADKGISAITKLIESAQATARQARTAAEPVSTYALSVVGDVDVGDDIVATAQGDVDLGTPVDLGATLDTETITITVNGVDTVITINTTTMSHSDEVMAAIDAIDGISAALDGDDFLVITADDLSTTFSIAYSAAGVGTALGVDAGDYAATNTVIGGLDGTVTFQLGTGTVQTLQFGDGASGEILTRAALETRLAQISAAMTGVTIEIDDDGFLSVSSTSSSNLTIGETSSDADDLGITANTYTPDATVTPNTTRVSLQADFNVLLQQITELARDASFNGINLLDNDDLTVIFNEDGSSSLAIQGVDFSASGLGLDAIATNGFQSNTTIDDVLADLDTAIATLRTQASKFGSNLSIVQARQDFTKNLISVLQVGADALVLADTNEEGANMLALQTRTQLSTVALSLAAQADQNVLQLF